MREGIQFTWRWALLTLFLASCAWQPITEPRRFDPVNEPTPLPLREAADKPTYTVERGTVAQRFMLRGRVGSVTELPIEAAQDGTIASLLVQDGDAVIADDLLALLDTQDIDAQLATLQRAASGLEAQLALVQGQFSAELTAATLALERATLQLENAQTSDATEADLRVLQIDVELAQLALDQIDENPDVALQAELLTLQQQIGDLELQKTTMRLIAPIDGDLAGLSLQLGGRVRAGSVIGSLINVEQRIIWADATNSELAQMEEGMSVQLALPDTPDELFDGTIAVLPFPHGSGGVRGEAVGVDSAELPPINSRVNILVTVAEQQDALWLPPTALREFAGQPFVIVQDGDSERRVDIEIGLTGAARVEIVSGLQAGDVIVAP